MCGQILPQTHILTSGPELIGRFEWPHSGNVRPLLIRPREPAQVSAEATVQNGLERSDLRVSFSRFATLNEMSNFDSFFCAKSLLSRVLAKLASLFRRLQRSLLSQPHPPRPRRHRIVHIVRIEQVVGDLEGDIMKDLRVVGSLIINHLSLPSSAQPLNIYSMHIDSPCLLCRCRTAGWRRPSCHRRGT